MGNYLRDLKTIVETEKEIPYRKLSLLFDKAGVPDEKGWRTIFKILFDPSMENKAAIQELTDVVNHALVLAARKDFSEKALLNLIQQYISACIGQYQKKLTDAINEIDQLTDEFKSMCLKRQGKVQILEKETIETVRSNVRPEEMIKRIKEKFKNTIKVFEKDVVKLNHLSYTDHLTTLFNRRFFDNQLKLEIGRAVEEKLNLNLLMIDIDDFKQFNDTYGHLTGDQALKTVSKMIRLVCVDKGIQSGIEFYPTRFGSEEFAVIMPMIEIGQSTEIAESIREKIGGYTFVIRNQKGGISHDNIQITVSIGVSAFNADWGGNGMNQLIRNADAALYKAKQSGKDCVKIKSS